MRTSLVAVLIAVSCVGCRGVEQRAALPSAGVARQQEGLQTVAFAHLIRSGGGASAFYLAIHDGGRDLDPPLDMVRRFAGVEPPVYGSSRCEVRGEDVFDRETGEGGGVLLRLSPPRWLDERRVELRAEYRFGGRNAAIYRLRLVRTEAGWRVEEEQPLWAAEIESRGGTGT